ncbi:MAG: AI-2E family transporter [Clostridiales bacterium]|nr:AI-2E family transporter [Clostridiales bacterium]
MKFQKNPKYATIAFYTFIVLALGILTVFFFIKNGDVSSFLGRIISILRPVLLGIGFAYVLSFQMVFYEKKLFSFCDKMKYGRRLRRALGLVLTYLILLILLGIVFWVIIPQVGYGYTDLSGKLPSYINAVVGWLEAQASSGSIIAPFFASIIDAAKNALNTIYDLLSQYMPNITSFVTGIANAIKDVLLGLILSVYFLAAKERLIAQAKKLMRAMFKDKIYTKLGHAKNVMNQYFGRFVYGKLMDSIICGVISLFVNMILGVPYYPLISLITAITNFVPIFGPIIGGLITTFIVFISNPDIVIWYVISFVVIQVIDYHFIMRRLLKVNLGFSAAFVFLAVVLMAGIFGLAGAVVAVPLFAVAYIFIKELVDNRLSKKGESTELADYASNDKDREIIIADEEHRAKVSEAFNKKSEEENTEKQKKKFRNPFKKKKDE